MLEARRRAGRRRSPSGATCRCSRRGGTSSTRPPSACSRRPAGSAPDRRRVPDRRRAARPLPAAAGRARRRSRPHPRSAAEVVAVTRRLRDKLQRHRPRRRAVRARSSRRDGTRERVLAQRGDRRSAAPTPRPTRSAPRACRAPARRELAGRIAYGIPDVLGATASGYAGKRVLVVGGGHSAMNALRGARGPAPRGARRRAIVWAVRRRLDDDRLFGGGENDALPARGALGRRVPDARRRGRHRARHRRADRRARGRPPAGSSCTTPTARSAPVDEIVACTGFRPNLEHAARDARWSSIRRSRRRPRLAPHDRSQRALLRHGAPARRRSSSRHPEPRLLHRRHEELRPRADVPAAHRLRAGALDRRRPRRRLGGRRARRARAARDRRLQRPRHPRDQHRHGGRSSRWSAAAAARDARPASEIERRDETRYGWVIVVALGVAVTVSYGVLSYAFAVLVVPMQQDLDASRAAITGAASVALLASAAASIPVGRLLDRISPRLVMATGAVAASTPRLRVVARGDRRPALRRVGSARRLHGGRALRAGVHRRHQVVQRTPQRGLDRRHADRRLVEHRLLPAHRAPRQHRRAGAAPRSDWR